MLQSNIKELEEGQRHMAEEHAKAIEEQKRMLEMHARETKEMKKMLEEMAWGQWGQRGLCEL